MMLVMARPVGVLVSTPSRSDRNVDNASGQLMQCVRDFPQGASQPVYRDHHEVIAFTEPAHARRPTRSVATGASGSGIGEDSVGCNARRRNGVVLLVDGLLSGGHPEVRGDAHSHMQPLRSDKSSGVRPTESRTRL
jgi:hypothetical protein